MVVNRLRCDCMIFKNIHAKSYLPKIFIAAAILGSIYVSGYLMFASADNILPLFKYTRHTNYFGDIVLFAGLATVAHQIQLLVIPFAMASFFIIIIIPLKESYLKNKYGKEYISYAANTKRLIPFIF